MNHRLAIVAASLALAFPLAAGAQDHANVESPPMIDRSAYENDQRRRAEIDVIGSIPLDCSVTFARDGLPVNLVAQSSRLIDFGLRCNASFRLRAISTNGALRHTAAYDAADPATFLNYQIVWPTLIDWTGQQLGSSFSTTGGVWSEGLVFTSGAPAQEQTGPFEIRWSGAENLIAGEYRETFVVEIEAVS